MICGYNTHTWFNGSHDGLTRLAGKLKTKIRHPLKPNSMEQSSRRFFLITSLLLCLVLIAVLVAFGYLAPFLRTVFAPYQFFLIGICVGALIAATMGLIVERDEWSHYRVYLVTVLTSVFLLAVINSVMFKLLEGEDFIRKLMRIFWVVFHPG
jgi:hypothetical protein